MKPLIVLLLVSGIFLLIQRLIYDAIKLRKTARIGMSTMLLFTEMGQFYALNKAISILNVKTTWFPTKQSQKNIQLYTLPN